MKERYESISMEIIRFEATDVVTDSSDTPLPETGE